MAGMAELRGGCLELSTRLASSPHVPELHTIYLDLVPLIGQLQGAVSLAQRTHGETPPIQFAQTHLEQLKAIARQVGLDIRLASEAALLLGLQSALDEAFQVLDQLEQE